jgi:hypothetical protein
MKKKFSMKIVLKKTFFNKKLAFYEFYIIFIN